MRHHKIPNNWTAYVASDKTSLIHFLSSKLKGHARYLHDLQRLEGKVDNPEDEDANENALVELTVLSRAKHFIGTRYSTFSMLAAAMRENSHHHMVYPGFYPQCIQASSPYNSLAQFEKPFSFATFSMFVWSDTSCINQQIINNAQALGGTFNPYTETLTSVTHWYNRTAPLRHDLQGTWDYRRDVNDVRAQETKS